jgi:hypothetical protein
MVPRTGIEPVWDFSPEGFSYPLQFSLPLLLLKINLSWVWGLDFLFALSSE